MIGQDHAKKVLSVAVYNHYKRIYHNCLHSVISSPTQEQSAAVNDAKHADVLYKLSSSPAHMFTAKGDKCCILAAVSLLTCCDVVCAVVDVKNP